MREQAPELLELPGCGTLTAAKLVAEIAGVSRFATDAKLARHAGAAAGRARELRVAAEALGAGDLADQLGCGQRPAARLGPAVAAA